MTFFTTLVFYIGTLLASAALQSFARRGRKGDPDEIKPPRVEPGAPLPIVFGTVRIAPNVTWFQVEDFRYLSDGKPLVKFGLSAALCHGIIDTLVDITLDDGTHRLAGADDLFPVANGITTHTRFELLGASGGSTPWDYVHARSSGMVGWVDFYWGLDSQPQSAYLLSKMGANRCPAYKGQSYIVLESVRYFDAPQIPPFWVTVKRTPATIPGMDAAWRLIGDGDANAACIAYEILTDERWGLQVPAADLDVDSFLACAEVLYTEGRGVSGAIESHTTAQDVIDDLMRHVDGVIQTDPVTGLVRMDLVRDDDAAESTTLTVDNTAFVECTRPAGHELRNTVKVTYRAEENASNTDAVRVMDLTAVQRMGGQRVEPIDLAYFRDRTNAHWAGARALRALALPLARLRGKTNREAAGFRIGSKVLATWADAALSSTAFRITRIDWGSLEEGTIEWEAVEDASGSTALSVTPPGDPTESECPVTLQESGVGTGLQWIPWPELGINEGYDGWLFDIQTFITSGAPNGINVGGTELGEDGWEVGGWTLFACGFANITVSRWLGGFEPGQYVTIAGTTSNWSSTAPVRAQTGYEWADPTTPGYHIVDTILDAGEWVGALNTIRFNGYADHEGRIKISVSWSWGGCDENFIHRMSFTEVLDYSGGCDPDEMPPHYSPPTLEQVIPETSASTLTLTAIIGDETDAVEGGFAVVHFQTWDGSAWVDVGTYTKGTATGTASKVDDDPLTIQATVTLPADGSPVTWRVVIESYDSTDVLVEGDEEIGEGRAEVSAIALGGDLSGTLDNATVIGIQTVPVDDTAPTTGQALVYDGAAYVPTTVLAPTRADFTITTASLANGASENGTVTLPRLCALIGALSASRDCWLRLYATATARTADSARLRTADPTAGAGVLFEAIFATGTSNLTVGPIAHLANGDSTPADTIYYAITNDGSTGTVVITGKAVRLETT